MILSKYLSLVFLFYLLVNFLYFPLALSFPDEHRFMGEVKKFSETFSFYTGDSRAWEMPFIAVFYSFFYKLFAKSGMLIVLRLIQSFLLIINAVLISKISYMVFKDSLAKNLSLIIMLFYPFFIFYSGLLLSESFFVFFLITAFYFLYKYKESSFCSLKYFVLTNAFFALATYTKASMTFLPVILISSFYYFNNNFNFFKSLKIFIYSLITFCIFLSPWWLRNYMIFDKTVLFTTTSGFVMYLGNNSNNLNADIDISRDVESDKVAKIRELKDEVLVNEAFKKEAFSFIKENPKEFLSLAFLKLKRFYNIKMNTKKHSYIYSIIVFITFTPILIFFILGVFLNKTYYKSLSPIYILILYFTLVHMILIASLRYRLPIEPFLILLACASFSKIYKKFRGVYNEK